MRSLNECQAEVFRRSEKRIKERKQRRSHILTACIPLALFITISGAFIFPDVDDPQQSPGSVNEHYTAGTDAAAEGSFAGRVEVSGNGISHDYSSAEDVQGIMSLIQRITAVPETDDSDEIHDFAVENSSSTDLKGNGEDKAYKILVKRSDGSVTEYLLLGSMLIDQSEQKAFRMDENTSADLKSALGIPFH